MLSPSVRLHETFVAKAAVFACYKAEMCTCNILSHIHFYISLIKKKWGKSKINIFFQIKI